MSLHDEPLYIHSNFPLKRTINFNLLCFTFQTPTFRFRPGRELYYFHDTLLEKLQHFATQKSEFVAGRTEVSAGEGERFISYRDLFGGSDMKSLSWKSNFFYRERSGSFGVHSKFKVLWENLNFLQHESQLERCGESQLRRNLRN